jgi:uncharacterized membrane protein
MSQALSINNRGAILGIDAKDLDGDFPQIWPVVWTPATSRLTTLKPLAGDEIALPTDINDAGAVIGMSYSLARDDNIFRPALWEPGRATPCRLATTSRRALSGDESIPHAINDHGQIVGTQETNEHPQSSGSDNTVYQRPVVWSGCGTPTQLLPFDREKWAVPNGINNRGQIVGYTLNDNNAALTWTVGQS